MNKKLRKAIKRFKKECRDEKTFPKNSRGETFFSALYSGFYQMFQEEWKKRNG